MDDPSLKSKTLNKVLKRTYNEIEEQSKATRENNEMLQVMENFN